jgi:hypothetical protein
MHFLHDPLVNTSSNALFERTAEAQMTGSVEQRIAFPGEPLASLGWKSWANLGSGRGPNFMRLKGNARATLVG